MMSPTRAGSNPDFPTMTFALRFIPTWTCIAIVAGAVYPVVAARAQADFEGMWVYNVPLTVLARSESELGLTPAGQADWDQYDPQDDPLFRCILPGVPRGLTDPYLLEIIQQEHQIVMLHEYFHQVRRIYTDGREAPEHWPLSMSGYSTGRWEDETLVVTTTHLSPDNAMNIQGHPFSGDEHTYVIQRYTRIGDELKLEAVVHDPTFYEEPYVIEFGWDLVPDEEIWTYECDPRFGDFMIEADPPQTGTDP